MSHRSPGRFLAPLALLAAVMAVALVVSSATGGEDDGDSGRPASSSSTSERGSSSTGKAATGETATGATTGGGSSRKTYRVKPGDTLGSIAEANGLSIEELQELNPDVDPQSLTVGQRLRLRR